MPTRCRSNEDCCRDRDRICYGRVDDVNSVVPLVSQPISPANEIDYNPAVIQDNGIGYHRRRKLS